MPCNTRRAIATILLVPVLSLALPAPVRAGEAFAASVAAQRVVVERLLVQHGVEPAQARARVHALTDEEAAQVAEKFGEMPAGGNFLAFLAAVLMVPLYLIAMVVAAMVSSKRSAGSTSQTTPTSTERVDN